jgi:transposase
MKISYYLMAREVIRHHKPKYGHGGNGCEPELIGKELLGALVGCSANAAGRHLARYRGETIGHSEDPTYKWLLKIAERRQQWSDHALVGALAEEAQIDYDQARRWVSWYRGATLPKPCTPAGLTIPDSGERERKGETGRYEEAKNVLAVNEAALKAAGNKEDGEEALKQIGSHRLARLLRCTQSTARRLRQKYWGETRGHAKDPVYVDIVNMREAHPTWGPEMIGKALGLRSPTVKVWLARYEGALVHEAKATESKPMQPNAADIQTERLPQKALEALPPKPEQQGGAKVADEESGTAKAQARNNHEPNVTHANSANPNKQTLVWSGRNLPPLDQLLCADKIDLEKWHVENADIRKQASPHGDFVTIKARLQRSIGEDRIRQLLERARKGVEAAAVAKPIVPHRPSGSDILFELSLPDLHLGKYAVRDETGEDYGTSLAVQVYRDANDDLLARAAQSHHPEQILLIAGGDYYNVDNEARTTAHGTPQDEEGRWWETFAAGKELKAYQIQRCLEVAPVHVIFVEGNHDKTKIMYLREVMMAQFAGHRFVTFDRGWSPRKYYCWHHVLLGFTHGNMKHEKLPMLMANEQRQAWASATYAEWQVGHEHCRALKQGLLDLDRDQATVRVRLEPTLSGKDAWHARMGYQARRAAQAYVYDQFTLLTQEIHTPRGAYAEILGATTGAPSTQLAKQ